MSQNQYYKYSDLTVEEYHKMFGEISQLKSNKEFCDYFIDFVVKNYTMQGREVEPFEGKIGDLKVKQWILGSDMPGMHHKPNYQPQDFGDIHRRIFKTWNKTTNDDYMKNHLMIEIMMFLSHTGNPCSYQQGLENVISYHKILDPEMMKKVEKYHKDSDWKQALNLKEEEYEKEDSRNKGKRTYYEVNKEKFLKLCTKTDEELRKQSEDRDGEDFNWREFILCKKFENFLVLTRAESPDGTIKLSFHSYHQEFRIMTEKVNRHCYRILDFTYNPDGTITTSDNPVFDKRYVEAIDFGIDDVEPSNIDTRYDFHGLDNRNFKNKQPFATDTNTFTFLRLKDQAYEFDNWILHDCRFSTDIIEATLYPIVPKKMVAEAYGLTEEDNFDYLDYWTKLFIDYFYTIKKYAFNMHFCYLIHDPKLMAIYNMASGWNQKQKISFFESKRIFKHLYCLIKNSGHKLSEVKNVDDLKSFLFEEEFLKYIPVYIREEDGYFMLTADLDIESMNKIIMKTGVAPVSASKDVIRNINRRDGAIITKDKSDEIKTKKDFKKYLEEKEFIVTLDKKMYLSKKIIDKELREIPVDRLNQSRNLGNYFTAIEFIEKFCAAFVSDRELGFDDDVIYTFLKPVPEQIIQNTDYFSMERVFNDHENGRNFIKTLNVDSIANNLKEHGFFMKMKPEMIYHYVNNREFKGTLHIKRMSLEEINKIQNYEDLFLYREKNILKSIRNILVNGSTDYNLDVEKSEGIDFKYSRRWMVPIYNSSLNVEEVLVYEMIYNEIEDREAIRDDNDTLSTLIDAMKMAFELNVPFNTRISTKAKLVEFHDNLSYTLNLLKQEKENDYAQYQINLPYMPLAAIVSHYYEGYTVLDDNMKIANEGNQQRNCILSYKDRAAAGTLMLLSYQDPKEGRTSIEIRAENGGKPTPEGLFLYNIVQNKLKANRNPRKELETQLKKQLTTVDIKTEGFNAAMLDICIANFFRGKDVKCDLKGNIIDPDDNTYGYMDYTGENILKCSLESFKANVKALTSMGDEDNKKKKADTRGDKILKDFMFTFGIKNLKELKTNPEKALMAYGKNVLRQPIGNMDPKVIEGLKERIEEAALEAV